MNQLFSDRLINLSLRGLTILLKFVLSILIIKELSLEDYGIFGLFQSSIIILSFIVGFDFYTFSSREILKKDAKPVNYYFTNQLVFHLFAYIVILPLSYFIFYSGIIDFKYFVLFILILVSEHLSQEIYRILIILNKSVIATTVLFFRSGLWIIALYIVWNQNYLSKSIDSILILWLIGAIISVILGFNFLNLKKLKKLDVKWILLGVKVALPFFIGTIFYKLIEFSGRYFLIFFYGESEVGVFTFFTSIANILFVFVQTIVIIERYPKLIEAKEKGKELFLVSLKVFNKEIIQYSMAGFVLSIVFIYPLLWFLDKIELFESFISYIILLISSLMFCLSFISHYALYSYKRDFYILKATTFGLMINLVMSFLLIPRYSVLGASIAQLAAFFSMFVLKVYFWKKIKISEI